MGTYNIHAGHSLICRGASKYLDEVNEDRQVKDKVISLLREAGNTVYDCTDSDGTTQKENLSNIVKKCNSHTVDLDVSIHLNSAQTPDTGTGVEVWVYSEENSEVASRIADEVSKALGLTNRGVKESTNLYVLKHTKAKAVLVECCFVDSQKDAAAWNTDKCARAIVNGILGTVDEVQDVKVVQSTYPHKGETCKPSKSNANFEVRVNIPNLRIRKGPGTNTAWTGKYTKKGVFTIVEVSEGVGSVKGWGRLKSNAGWISLDHVTRL